MLAGLAWSSDIVYLKFYYHFRVRCVSTVKPPPHIIKTQVENSCLLAKADAMKFEDCGAENPSYDDLNLEHRGAVKVPFFCFGAMIYATYRPWLETVVSAIYVKLKSTESVRSWRCLSS